jgi:nucleoid DNA-binding protein
MNNKEYIAKLSSSTEYTQEDTQKLVRTVIDGMIELIEVDPHTSISIPSFGTFEVKKRMERIMVNPTTKQRMLVPPKLVLNFRPDASIKEKLKNGGKNE